MSEVYNHQPRQVGVDVQRRINALGIGQKMQDLPEELWHESFRFYVKEDPTRKGGPNLRIIRLDPNQPSLTVTGYIFNKFVHPYENRFITPREAARLQGFPDNLEFKGTLTSVQRQVGDAVPVELGQAVFTSLLNHFSTNWPHQKTFCALSLFSGAGGLDIGAEQAKGKNSNRLKTFACVEIETDRCDTLREYFGERVRVFNHDITTIDSEFVLNSCQMSFNNVWLLYGGPPCQSFSQAGKQKGTGDPRGKLIFEFLRFVGEILPPFFVMENVANLKGINKGKLLDEILSEIDKLGYNVDYRILNAAQYGNPQKRRRYIFLGSKKELAMAKLPDPTHSEKANLFGLPQFKTVGEAFAFLPSPDYEPVQV
ncbi:MAG: DNA (cytosine-5-)-methyltransferase [Deltaproteobacteria bacterium]|nr:DNA (cytosine-5-)-methyltransferase [Deltaproteobacteria bacterium]